MSDPAPASTASPPASLLDPLPLARALIRAETSPEEEVPSPTFTLVQTYEGRRFALSHFDLYRLADAAEAEELGLWEALDGGAAVVEWPERLGSDLPPERLDVEIGFVGAGRSAGLVGYGEWARRLAGLELKGEKA